MNIVIMPNVTHVDKFEIRTIYLDENKILCPLSEDLFSDKGERSYQEVDIDKIYYTICHDPFDERVLAREILDGHSVKALRDDEMACLLDNCGIGLLAWLTSEGLAGCDISYYVEPQTLNEKVIRKTHKLKDMFPNLPEEFIENIVLKLQCSTNGEVLPFRMSGELLQPTPKVREDIRLISPIESATVRSIANRRTVFPKVIRGHMGIPAVLPIAYYQYGHRKDQHVRSSLYLLDNNDVETVVNLCEYVALLDLPSNWFTSILYTLPPNLKQVVYVVHRPFLTKHATSNRGTIMHVYTC